MSESADAEKTRPQKSLPWKRRKIIYWSVGGGLAAAFVLALVVALAVHFGRRKDSAPPATTEKDPGNEVDTWVGGPVIATNFADPCFIDVDSTYYAFATNLHVNPHPGQINIQVAVSKDFSAWNLTGIDALPDVGPWSTGTYTWAPDVIQLDDGSFVMYYSSRVNNSTRHHCVSAATSKNVLGPYAPLPEPIVCPLSQGGAIDPDGFEDVDGKRYLIYKVDGNSLNNSTSKDHPTPIMIQEVDTDGITFIGNATKLIDHGPQDGPLVEAPSMTRAADVSGKSPVYVLFYSSNIFTTMHYNVGYATSTTSILGPYTKSANPLLQTGDDLGKLYGPGGLDVGVGGERVVFHSGYNGGAVVRQMWTGQIAVNGTTVYI